MRTSRAWIAESAALQREPGALVPIPEPSQARRSWQFSPVLVSFWLTDDFSRGDNRAP